MGKELIEKEDYAYALIRIAEKTRTDDAEYVDMHVSGDQGEFFFRLKRGEIIPVPKLAISALISAKLPVFETPKTNEYGAVERRKAVRFTPRFSFERLRKIGKSEYDRLRALVESRQSGLTDAEAFAV